MNFHAGQKVVCVDDRDISGRKYSYLNVGDVYTIGWVGSHTNLLYGVTCVCVHLIEVKRPPGRLHGYSVPFRADRFRPMKETDISIFTAMLAPSPKITEPV